MAQINSMLSGAKPTAVFRAAALAARVIWSWQTCQQFNRQLAAASSQQLRAF
jgi:hypothetical protein